MSDESEKKAAEASGTVAKEAAPAKASGGRRWLRRVGIGLGILAGVILVGLGVAYGASTSKQARTYDVIGANFTIPNDPALLAEGERLFVSRGCGDGNCHRGDAGGGIFELGPLGSLSPANLTVVTAGWQGADWDRAVRHGLHRDGTSLVFMPAADFVNMSDRELATIVAYVRSLPRVERELPPNNIGMLGRVLDLAGMVPLFPASVIDHEAVSAVDPEPGRTVEYGEYLAHLCQGCHGPHFSGGPIPGAPPELGVPRNLTPHETGLEGWTEEQFRTVLRTGRRPGGEQISERQMPWPAIGRMSDDEIGAVFLYLQQLPPLPEGSR